MRLSGSSIKAVRNRRSEAITDTDVLAYIAAVETTDGQELENPVKIALSRFIVGCKNDGIFNLITSSCILLGARTIDGALTPLKGPAPTKTGFPNPSGNRRSGLKGNASTWYLSTNVANDSVPQDSQHMAILITEYDTGGADLGLMGPPSGATGVSKLGTTTANYDYFVASRGASVNAGPVLNPPTFLGVSRVGSTESYWINDSTTGSFTGSSSASDSSIIDVFRENGVYTNARIAFYSFGSGLTLDDLTKLRNRVMLLYQDAQTI